MNGDYESAIQAAYTIYNLNETLSGNLYRLRQWTGTLEELPPALKKRKVYVADRLLEQRKLPEFMKFIEAASDSLYQPQVRLYYQILGNYLLRRDAQVKKLGSQYLALNDENVGRKMDVLGMLGREVEFRQLLVRPGQNLEEDLYLQWNMDADILSYLILSGDYAEATLALKAIQKNFPQVGDYAWLSWPINDRIKSDYPAFKQTLEQMAKRPRFMNPDIPGS